MKYRLSKHVRIIEMRGLKVAYHRIYGNLSVLTPSQHGLLRALNTGAPVSQLNANLLKKFTALKYVVTHEEGDITLAGRHVESLHRVQRIRNFKGIILKATDDCNFNCNYCIDRMSGLQGTAGNMKPGVALAIIDHFLQFCHRHEKYKRGPVTIGFNGGEPLINLRLIEACIAFIEANHPDALVEYDINTNSALITAEVARYLQHYRFSITTSLDGAMPVNDVQRKSKERSTSAFLATIAGLKYIKDIDYSSHVTILVVLTDKNIDRIDQSFFRYVKDTLGICRVLIEPDMSRALKMNPHDLANRVYAIKNEAQELEGFCVGGGWSTPFMNLIEGDAHGIPSYCSALSGFSVNVFPSGDIRACNYLDSSFTMLNLRDVTRFEDIIDHEAFVRSIENNYGCAKAECVECDIRGLCKGGCLVTANRGKEVKAYHCDFLRKITDLLIKECVEDNIRSGKEVTK